MSKTIKTIKLNVHELVMIEVEIKVPLDEGAQEKLLAGAVLVRTVTLRDVYYDNTEYSLTLANQWLRERNGSFELKLPPSGGARIGDTAVQRYVELTSDTEIMSALGIKPEGSLIECLEQVGIRPFATITSGRQKYKKGRFTIDVDETDFGYSLAEVELMADGDLEVDVAHKEIIAFLEECGIGEVKRQLGKLAFYLRLNSPDHFQALVEAGVITATVEGC